MADEVKVGEEISFTSGDGWGIQGHVGRVIAIEANGVVVMTDGEPRLVAHDKLHRGAIRWGEVRESPLDYADRIQTAIKRQNCPVRDFVGTNCPVCGSPRASKA